jgi:hypothetical protein
LYVPGIALLLIAAAAVAWVSTAARGVRLARSLGGPAVQERVDLPITVSLVRSHLPLPGAELRAWDEGRRCRCRARATPPSPPWAPSALSAVGGGSSAPPPCWWPIRWASAAE